MSDDKIAEIRARHNHIEETWWAPDDPCVNQAHDDRGYLLAEVERLTRECDEAWSKETDYGEGFEEGWAAAQKQAAAEVVRLRKEAWIGAAFMLSGLAMILGSGLILAWSYLP